MTCTELCEETESEKVDYIGYVLGYCVSEFCNLDVKDDEEKHREYVVLGEKYRERHESKYEEEMNVMKEPFEQQGMYRVVFCDGDVNDYSPEDVRGAVLRLGKMVWERGDWKQKHPVVGWYDGEAYGKRRKGESVPTLASEKLGEAVVEYCTEAEMPFPDENDADVEIENELYLYYNRDGKL